MTVLRTETATIPAQTLKTTIIGIPANDWSRLELKKNISAVYMLTCTIALIIFFWSGMPDINNTANVARAIFGLDILGNVNNRESWLVMMFATSCCLISLFAFAFTIIDDSESTLLKKHGWDGESRYKVELEYPQHFLLD